MKTIIPVQSKEIIVTNTINNVVIKIINIKLSNFANISAIVRQDDQFIRNYTFHLEGDEYHQWGSNDDYIVNYVLMKIGLSKKN